MRTIKWMDECENAGEMNPSENRLKRYKCPKTESDKCDLDNEASHNFADDTFCLLQLHATVTIKQRVMSIWVAQFLMCSPLLNFCLLITH